MTDSPGSQRHDARINGIANTETSMSARGLSTRTLPDICFELQAKVDAFLSAATDDDALRKVQNQVRVSMDVIREALRRYGPDHLSLSYNGGKDCLVLLVLILACLPGWTSQPPPPDHWDLGITTSERNRSSTAATSSRPLQAIYIVSQHPFPEVEDFVAKSAETYHLDLKRYALPMRPALEAYLEDRPAVKAIFLGTRRTDPHGEFLTHFDPTDDGWPRFMRVHPVIDWHYVEIWAFIRHLQIPFCELYNRGFTSLGGVTDTRPNPALAVGGDNSKFRPAYELKDDDEERLGRD
ncbi:70f8aa20-9092-4f2a-bc31-79816f618393 [Thermothielavioides terrestris]|uniref:FAD synthase n=2 Tax=Thermothielavioides terrestris TaxID=2587410 RepID=G2RA54_THETT|nr:uncharacterized protein THITE_2171095 [Thermothielavioides terrestris NRRL 8126]AEO69642.1 hypothetical protein THITE_2171095 [Thermothielavioides terrestris NRRL 8126]SPQ26162.1 70f8aa20-9092-4f2a-bc31-79816f618393 [Thermothielavioides terrestris]